MKNIHIGEFIEARCKELDIPIERICKFFKLNDEEIEKMFQLENMNSDHILKWCKLLGYDFFRLYSQHLILYSPEHRNIKNKNTSLPQFRKNIYTKEIINFILTEINDGSKTKEQVIEYYRIPKTTLYKWISKYNNEKK
ncbi:DEAD/DEAH box helicase family protein [Chryseobacterium panacisoli]|uniref:transposase n=1 Tax=Chryseobacterium panacisoli TaxID=1807141 RepID=UPI00293950F9|nr:transposase [Chryseobacterium panacisoli]